MILNRNEVIENIKALEGNQGKSAYTTLLSNYAIECESDLPSGSPLTGQAVRQIDRLRKINPSIADEVGKVTIENLRCLEQYFDIANWKRKDVFSFLEQMVKLSSRFPMEMTFRNGKKPTFVRTFISDDYYNNLRASKPLGGYHMGTIMHTCHFLQTAEIAKAIYADALDKLIAGERCIHQQSWNCKDGLALVDCLPAGRCYLNE